MKQEAHKSIDSDIVGVGFGPAGVSFACAVADWSEDHGITAVGAVTFCEKALRTAWCPELFLPGADVGHHVFHDLVTPRNPRSRFSFAMYLKEKGRIYKFGLLERPASRMEWSDYISWVAAQLTAYVRYDEPVIEVLPGLSGGRLTHLEVVTKMGKRRTRNLVLSNGSSPRVPKLFREHLGSHVFHTSEYFARVSEFGTSFPQRWLIVGSRRSASEVTVDLLHRGTDVFVRSLHRSDSFRLPETAQFPNVAFLPEQVDYLRNLESDAQQQSSSEIEAINYVGLDLDENQILFPPLYENMTADRERRHLLKMYCQATSVAKVANGYAVTVRDIFNNDEHTFEVDGVVLATGYEQPLIPPVLATLQPWLTRGDDGRLVIDRDYRVRLVDDEADINIFLNGLSERTHDINNSQSFSLMAMRSERILNSIVRSRHKQHHRAAHSDLT